MSGTYNGERIISSINGVRKPGNSVWWFFTNLKIELPYDSPTPLLGIYSKEMKIGYRRNICTLFTAALSSRVKVWKQPKCPSMGEWIKTKMW